MNKKISILTFSTGKNYGAILQMYALQKATEKNGFIVEQILYRNNKSGINVPLYKKIVSFFYNKVFAIFFKDRKRQRNEINFRKNINFSSSIYTNTNDLRSIVTDAFLVGSDQVWNPYCNGYDNAFFIPFETKAAKLTYAVSIGDSFVDKEWINKNIEFIKQFSNYSFREENSQEIIKSLNLNYSIDLDPTLLITKSQWNEYFSLYQKVTRDYVLCYMMPGNKALTKKMIEEGKKYARTYKLNFIIIGAKDIYRLVPSKYYKFGIGPLEFMKLIYNAKAVFTNSFHGTAFSINFNKTFFTYCDIKGGLKFFYGTRIPSLLSKLKLVNRIRGISNSDDIFALKGINYDNVNLHLNQLRKTSYKNLSTLLSKIN